MLHCYSYVLIRATNYLYLRDKKTMAIHVITETAAEIFFINQK